MSWTAVALIAIMAVVLIVILYLIVAVFVAKKAADLWRKESEEFDRRWDERRERRGH